MLLSTTRKATRKPRESTVAKYIDALKRAGRQWRAGSAPEPVQGQADRVARQEQRSRDSIGEQARKIQTARPSVMHKGGETPAGQKRSPLSFFGRISPTKWPTVQIPQPIHRREGSGMLGPASPASPWSGSSQLPKLAEDEGTPLLRTGQRSVFSSGRGDASPANSMTTSRVPSPSDASGAAMPRVSSVEGSLPVSTAATPDPEELQQQKGKGKLFERAGVTELPHDVVPDAEAEVFAGPSHRKEEDLTLMRKAFNAWRATAAQAHARRVHDHPPGEVSASESKLPTLLPHACQSVIRKIKERSALPQCE